MFNLLSFAGVLYSISPPLLVFLASYAAAGTYVTTRVFGRRLTALNAACFKAEGDFRFGLARMREHAESVAFYGGARAEAGLAAGLLYRLAGALFERIACERKLNIFGAQPSAPRCCAPLFPMQAALGSFLPSAIRNSSLQITHHSSFIAHPSSIAQWSSTTT